MSAAVAVAAGLDAVGARVVEWRRHLHRHPELSFEEHETAAFLAGRLAELPGVEVLRPTPTSVLGRLRGGAGEGQCVVLRADIDALPVTEETALEYRSTRPGVMHACGHDGHAAMVLGAATVLAGLRDDLRGEIRFVFQHAEEMPPGGARELIAAGALDGADAVLGCHLLPDLGVGEVAVPAGACMAAADVFEVELTGRGGHAAWPHLTVDPVPALAELVTALQRVVARETDPQAVVVLSVTQLEAGTAVNVIPGTARLRGTVRAFDEAARSAAEAAIHRIAGGVAAAHGAEARVDYTRGYDVVVNDAEVARAVGAALEGTDLRVVELAPFPAGDDMATLLRHTPGAYAFVGARDVDAEQPYPLHHPRFSFDERALRAGTETLVRGALALTP